MTAARTTEADNARAHDRLNVETRAIRMLHAGDQPKLVAQTTGLDLATVKQLQRDFPGPRRTTAPPVAVDETRNCGHITELPIGVLRDNPANVRSDLGDPAELEELAQSIREHGLLQPVVVMRIDREYVLLAGHRRLAGCLMADLARVPVTFRDPVSDHAAVEKMLVENLQRTALHPLDEARAYHQLMRAGRTTTQIAKSVGKNVGTISQRLALLNLTDAEQKALRKGEITVDAGYRTGRDRSDRRRPHDTNRPKPKTVPHFTKNHPLAAEAAAVCTHDTLLKLGVACGPCWEATIRTDEQRLLRGGGSA